MSLSKERGSPTLVNNVQGLRAIAAILVVFAHVSLPHVGVEELVKGQHPWLAPMAFIGPSGVDIFFVISGFIMLVTNWQAFGKRGASVGFFLRRVIRIYPPYWLALIPALAALLLAPDRLMVLHVGHKTGFIESIFLLPNPYKFILTPAWTLVWEMFFYVVFAFVLLLDRRYVVPALGIWFAIELGLHFAGVGSQNFYVRFASSPLPLEFIFGTLIGLLYVKRQMPAPWLFAALACVVLASGWFAVGSSSIAFKTEDLRRIFYFGIPAALLVYSAVALELHGAFRFPKQLTALGDASYAVYLWHISVLVALRQVVIHLHPAGPVWHLVLLIVAPAAVLVIGEIVYRTFERPVTSYLNGLLRRRPPAPRPAVIRTRAGGAPEEA